MKGIIVRRKGKRKRKSGVNKKKKSRRVLAIEIRRILCTWRNSRVYSPGLQRVLTYSGTDVFDADIFANKWRIDKKRGGNAKKGSIIVCVHRKIEQHHTVDSCTVSSTRFNSTGNNRSSDGLEYPAVYDEHTRCACCPQKRKRKKATDDYAETKNKNQYSNHNKSKGTNEQNLSVTRGFYAARIALAKYNSLTSFSSG